LTPDLPYLSAVRLADLSTSGELSLAIKKLLQFEEDFVIVLKLKGLVA
jgi:hypothetical protein